MLKHKLILASRSPRRKKLLEQIGIPFSVHVSPVEEKIPKNAVPAECVCSLAMKKARAVAISYPDNVTLGADTIVVLNNHILGKPTSTREAVQMLHQLSGQTHTVYTGIALAHVRKNRYVSVHEATDVTFAPLTDEEISSYVASGSPMDKAGSYGIQDDRGALFISRIEGDYYNVVGLPLHRLYRVIKQDFPYLLADEVGAVADRP